MIPGVRYWALRDHKTGLPVALDVYAFDKRIIFDTAHADCGENLQGDESLFSEGLAVGLCCRCDQPTTLWRRRSADEMPPSPLNPQEHP